MHSKAKKQILIILAMILTIGIIGIPATQHVQAASAYITAKTLHMSVGQSATLKVKHAKSVKWTSSNKNVVSVSKGKVKARKAGTATITAKAGKKKYKCTVTVADGTKKSLIIYFSATGTTKTAAKKIRTATGADMVRLQPRKAYTKADLNYNNSSCRANREQSSSKSRPAIATVIRNLDQYDTIYLGYPIWHGKEPKVIRTFLDKYSMKGKTIMPFCTSGGSGIGGSKSGIRAGASGATVNKGLDFADATKGEITAWLATAPQEPVVQPEPEGKSKTLVAYFSATGTTKNVAGRIADLTGADSYEIVPVQPYTTADLNYNDSSSRATIEQNDSNARPAIVGTVVSLEEYDRIFIGYPIWWGDAPRIMRTFVESCDFSDKTVIPFCTSASSGIGQSATTLASLAGSGTWKSGQRFGRSVSNDELQNWINGLD